MFNFEMMNLTVENKKSFVAVKSATSLKCKKLKHIKKYICIPFTDELDFLK